MPTGKVLIVSNCFAAGLYPDSRNYVMFELLYKKDDEWGPFSAAENLTCEYLVDLTTLVVETMRWISTNCTQITHEGTHLYWKFRDENDPPIKAAAVAPPNFWRRLKFAITGR